MPGGHGDVDAAQRGARGARVRAGARRGVRAGVAEAHVVEPYLAADLPERVRVGRLGDVHRQVEVLEDAAEQLERALDVHAGAEQLDGGPVQALLQGGERDERADRDGHVVAPAGQPGHPEMTAGMADMTIWMVD